jgi:hypothetical protein
MRESGLDLELMVLLTFVVIGRLFVLFLGLCLNGRIGGLKRLRRCDDTEFDDDDDDTTCFFCHCIASGPGVSYGVLFFWVGKGYDRQRMARFDGPLMHVHFGSSTVTRHAAAPVVVTENRKDSTFSIMSLPICVRSHSSRRM